MLRIAIITIIALAYWQGSAHAAAYTQTNVKSHSTIRIAHVNVPGHAVRIVSWRPGDARARVTVRYGLRTPVLWGKSNVRALATLSGGTWTHTSMRTTGTVYAQGRKVSSGPVDYPAVGFAPSGRAIFGLHAARLAGARNILSGLAYLVRNGSAQSSFPWTTPAQRNCGALGTDGALGCWRTVVAEMKNGRTALILIRWASMAQAARILVHLGVENAMTGDSGGSAALWTRFGRSNCPNRLAGTCRQEAHYYERPVMDVVQLGFAAR